MEGKRQPTPEEVAAMLANAPDEWEGAERLSTDKPDKTIRLYTDADDPTVLSDDDWGN